MVCLVYPNEDGEILFSEIYLKIIRFKKKYQIYSQRFRFLGVYKKYLREYHSHL